MSIPVEGNPLLHETVDEAASPSRRNLLALGLLAGGALFALPAQPAQAVGYTEVQALRFLEEIELLQTDFFNRISASTAFDGMEDRERNVLNLIAMHDREHSEWFRLARRKFGIQEFGRMYTPNASSTRPPRMFSFPLEAFKTRATLFPLAASIKDTAVGAYHAMVGSVGDGEIIEALAALAGIEGRHAAALREISGVNSLPGAFESVVDEQEVARRFRPYGFRGEAIQ